MQINDRALLVIALVSGVAAWFLVYKLPGVAQVDVYVAKSDIKAGDILMAKGHGANVKITGVSAGEFSSEHLVPASMGALIEGRHAMQAVAENSGLSVGCLIPSTVKPKGKKGSNAADSQRYFILSQQLTPGQCAIAVASDALVTLGQALEPGDVIDLVFPNPSAASMNAATSDQSTPQSWENLTVLAVGGRTQDGWITGGDHTEENPTIVIAVPEAEAEHLARLFAAVGTARPRTVLHPRTSAN